jgi:hypothetical protein
VALCRELPARFLTRNIAISPAFRFGGITLRDATLDDNSSRATISSSGAVSEH